MQACLHCHAVKELRSRDVAAAIMHKVASQFRELHELQQQADHDLRRVERESATGRKKVTDLNVAYTYAICLQVWKWAMSPFGVTTSLPQGDSLVQNQLSNQTWTDGCRLVLFVFLNHGSQGQGRPPEGGGGQKSQGGGRRKSID